MVMFCEGLSPSAAIPALIDKAVRPKAAFLRELIGEVLGLNPKAPAVQRAVMFAVLRCVAMMVASKQLQVARLPAVANDKQALADRVVRFVMAGLEAIAVAHRSGKSANRWRSLSGIGEYALGLERDYRETFRYFVASVAVVLPEVQWKATPLF